ncbi:Nif3-like dinuclear metal center hexameric protein [Sulfurospirillum multivorans]|uniref:GTP cyclohydrolase 1 type 2 homolog n=2 Tax=Sulfurospirillum multivorans TaxID=66821 RepID=A0AA86DYR5_SULMK|nr:Nif3-like dinuclear metal center hexameric protein [Sulfurospirillum multivorans]AHJ13548.1 NIF3 family protein [Sulfurospirillum multivorans DSM 12446]QEH07038.1 NIF3 family protein [Sulfurospirillum multivorans]
MKLGALYDFLDTLSPFATQASWDNSGLLIGSREDEVEQIYLSLDVDSALLEEVAENSLIITHHPLIFSSLKQLNFAKYPSNLIQIMVQKKISLIAMHTNFDLSHLNAFVASKLGFEIVDSNEFVAYCEVNQRLDDLALHVKHVLGIENLRIVRGREWVGRCAITTGAGGDLISKIEADCFLSGDLKYHQAMEAKENNLSLIDIGHFESERYFPECLAQYLKNLPLKAIMSNSKNPFEYK